MSSSKGTKSKKRDLFGTDKGKKHKDDEDAILSDLSEAEDTTQDPPTKLKAKASKQTGRRKSIPRGAKSNVAASNKRRKIVDDKDEESDASDYSPEGNAENASYESEDVDIVEHENDDTGVDDDFDSPPPAKRKKASEKAPRTNRTSPAKKPEKDKPKSAPKKTSKPKKTAKEQRKAEEPIDEVNIDAELAIDGMFGADAEDEFEDAAFEEEDIAAPAPDAKQTAETDLDIVLDNAANDNDSPNSKKRKRQSSDVKVRRATKEEKQFALGVHKLHVLSLLASASLASQRASKDLLRAAALSMLPDAIVETFVPSKFGVIGAQEHTKPPTAAKPKLQKKSKATKKKGQPEANADDDEIAQDSDETPVKHFNMQTESEFKANIAELMKAFKTNVQLTIPQVEPVNVELAGRLRKPFDEALNKIVAKLAGINSGALAGSKPSLPFNEAVIAFTAACRSIGLPARYVEKLKPISFKAQTVSLGSLISQYTAALNGESVGPFKKDIGKIDLSDSKSGSTAFSKGSSFGRASSQGSIKSDPIVLEDDDESTQPLHKSTSNLASQQLKSDPMSNTGLGTELALNASQESTAPLPPIPIPDSKTRPKRRRRSSGVGDEDSPPPEYWVEVYCNMAHRWICVDLIRDLIDEPQKFNPDGQPLSFVFAFEGKHIRDVTKRYSSKYTIAIRDVGDLPWLEQTLDKFNNATPWTDDELERTAFEENEFKTAPSTTEFPTSQEQYRNHPLYTLEKYVTRYFGLWPPDAIPVGYFKNQPIYSRKDVYRLHTRDKWVQEGKQVRAGEVAFKRMRKFTMKKKSEMTEMDESDYFGEWQTEDYQPPTAIDGVVPKNEYGNVYLFKPNMLPVGTAQVNLPGVKLICKRLGVDFGEAMTGWDIVKHYSRPRFEGVVVCAENEEIVIEAWRQDNERKLQQEIKKASERALGRWRLLTRRLLAKHHVASNYLGVGADGQIADEESSTVVKKRGKKAGGASTDKLRKRKSVSETNHEHSFPKEKWIDLGEGQVKKICECGFELVAEIL